MNKSIEAQSSERSRGIDLISSGSEEDRGGQAASGSERAFGHIAAKAKDCIDPGLPFISVDTKKGP